MGDILHAVDGVSIYRKGIREVMMMIEGISSARHEVLESDQTQSFHYSQSTTPAVLTLQRNQSWLTVALHRRVICIPKFTKFLDSIMLDRDDGQSSCIVHALHSYDAWGPKELSFKKGDALRVLRRHLIRTGWSLASLNDPASDPTFAEEGLVPDKFLEAGSLAAVPVAAPPPAAAAASAAASAPLALPDFALYGFGNIRAVRRNAPVKLRAVVARLDYVARLRDELSFKVLTFCVWNLSEAAVILLDGRRRGIRLLSSRMRAMRAGSSASILTVIAGSSRAPICINKNSEQF